MVNPKEAPDGYRAVKIREVTDCYNKCELYTGGICAQCYYDVCCVGEQRRDREDVYFIKEEEPMPTQCEDVKTQTALDVQVGGSHYKNLKIQPIEYMHANKLDYFQGAVVKYITRFRNKNGVEDLEKVKHMVDLLIQLEYPAYRRAK